MTLLLKIFKQFLKKNLTELIKVNHVEKSKHLSKMLRIHYKNWNDINGNKKKKTIHLN